MPVTINGTSGLVTATSYAGSGGNLTGITTGKVLQVVQTTKTNVFTTTTTSYSDITGMSANITMTSASNKVLVMVQQQIMADDAGTGIKIVRGSTDIFLGDASGSRARHTVTGDYASGSGENQYSGGGSFICYLDTPGAGTHTYKVQCMTRGGTIYVNRTKRDSDDTNASRSASSITLQEVAA